MFTPEQREALRVDLLERAKTEPRISAAAITGSASNNREDRWSDIDLAFGVASDVELTDLLASWTSHMYGHHLAIHHMDVRAGAWIYRVFLLSNTLQVDLAFVPDIEFRPLGPTFRLVFGKANDPQQAPPPSANDLIGMGWLYALHARSCIARRHLWQAEYMISGVRDHALALACLRHNLPTAHGRGFDQLPATVKAEFQNTLVAHLDTAELHRAFQATVAALLIELEIAVPALAPNLREALSIIASGASD